MAASEPDNYMSKLKDARVLVIGGTSGIGFGVAEALIQHGASVIIASSSQDRVSKVVKRLEEMYPSAKAKRRVQGFTCDLGSQEQVASEIEKLFLQVAECGILDHVVYTAGDALAIGKFEDFSLKDIQQAGMVRFFSPLLVAQHLRKHLKGGPASSFTMTNGGLSERPRKDWTVVMSYLTGLEGMSRALARDLAPIRVNLVGPGPVETELWSSHMESQNLNDLKASIAKNMATGVFGTVQDVAESYLYVMKDKNITGSIIYTNGGGLLL